MMLHTLEDFDALYRRGADPWSVGTDWYERRKLAVLMASLPRERYGCALDLGCGEGAAVRQLAARCGRVRAVDGSATAIARCRQWIGQSGARHVSADVLALPAEWPAGTQAAVDLLVVSELAYYLSGPDLDTLFQRCLQSLAPDADWVMCHFKEDFPERRHATGHLHGRVDALPGLRRIAAHDDERFRLDIWRKRAQDGA